MDLWPLCQEKIQAAPQLVQEQLDKGHIEPSTRPWNTPIFVIREKSGKWRLLQDVRKVNATMEAMGALQPGLPSPTEIPEGCSAFVIDLQDCFFTIPLHPDDRKPLPLVYPQQIYKGLTRGFNGKCSHRE